MQSFQSADSAGLAGPAFCIDWQAQAAICEATLLNTPNKTQEYGMSQAACVKSAAFVKLENDVLQATILRLDHCHAGKIQQSNRGTSRKLSGKRAAVSCKKGDVSKS